MDICHRMSSIGIKQLEDQILFCSKSQIYVTKLLNINQTEIVVNDEVTVTNEVVLSI